MLPLHAACTYLQYVHTSIHVYVESRRPNIFRSEVDRRVVYLFRPRLRAPSVSFIMSLTAPSRSSVYLSFLGLCCPPSCCRQGLHHTTAEQHFGDTDVFTGRGLRSFSERACSYFMFLPTEKRAHGLSSPSDLDMGCLSCTYAQTYDPSASANLICVCMYNLKKPIMGNKQKNMFKSRPADKALF